MLVTIARKSSTLLLLALLEAILKSFLISEMEPKAAFPSICFLLDAGCEGNASALGCGRPEQESCFGERAH